MTGEDRASLLPKAPKDVESDVAGATAQDEDVKKQKPLTMMKWMKQKAKAMKKESLAVFYAMQDDRTPWYAKILPFLALSYALCPLDLIPDFIPVLGLLDDILIVPGLLWLSFFLLPTDVMADARQRAKNDPIRLSRNWVAAVLVFLVWMAFLQAVIYWLATEVFWNVGPVRQGLWWFMAFVFATGWLVFMSWAREKAEKEKEKAKKAAAAAVHREVDESDMEETWDKSIAKAGQGSVDNV